MKPAQGEPRRRVGAVLIGLGIALLAWAVIYMNFSALGGPPAQRTFAHRRPYDQIKRSVHEAFPGFLLRAASGGLAIYFGARLRRRASTRSSSSSKSRGTISS